MKEQENGRWLAMAITGRFYLGGGRQWLTSICWTASKKGCALTADPAAMAGMAFTATRPTRWVKLRPCSSIECVLAS